MYKKIEITNTQNVELTGYFYENSSRTCILYIHGFCGAFDALPETIGEYVSTQNISFLCGLMQSSYLDCELKQYTKSHSVYTTKQGGSIYENYDDCLYDLSMWLDFLDKKFDNIYLIGHEMGVNKAIYLATQKLSPKIKGLIMLAPQDYSHIDENPEHIGMLQEATFNLTNNQPNQLLSGFFLGEMPISSGTYYDLINNPNLHNFCYKDIHQDFENIRNLNIPIKIIIGDLDPALENYANMRQINALFNGLATKIPNLSYTVMNGTTHSFRNREQDVAELVGEFIQNNNKIL